MQALSQSTNSVFNMSVSASIHLLVGLKSHPAKLQLLKMRPISYTMTLSAVSASPNQSNLTMDPILQIQLSNVSPRFLKFVISSLATPCYPQSNGRAERLIGTLGSISPRYRRGRRNRRRRTRSSERRRSVGVTRLLNQKLNASSSTRPIPITSTARATGS